MATAKPLEHTAPACVPPIVEPRYRLAFALVTSLFFSWALAAALNDVLIRQFQKALDLSRTQASLIQFAFYIGYFCAALPAGLLIRRFGYKRAMLAGLGLYAAGALLFYPAAEIREYGLFLTALYVIAFGLAFLETAANPYVSILGRPETASARLNLAQSFYGIGAVLGPVIGGLFIFSGLELGKEELAAMSPAAVDAYRATEAAAVQGPYLVVAGGVTMLMLLIALTRFPRLDVAAPAERRPFLSVLRHTRLRRAVAAQFFYVGAQVGIWSFFIDFAKEQTPSLSERTVAFLLSASLGLVLVGRMSGAFIQRSVAPARLLLIYACVSIALCAVAATAGGAPAVAALWLSSFFMSIQFPTIFALGVDGLGPETDAGSSFLIMSIIGGALVPPLMGYISDLSGDLRLMMLIPAVCFGVVVWFATTASREAKESGIA